MKSGFSRMAEAERKLREQRIGAQADKIENNIKKATGASRMVFWKKFEVGDNERALLFKGKNFQSLLKSGIHYFFGLPSHHRAAIFDLSKPEFKHPLAEFLYKEFNAVLETEVDFFQLGDLEIGLVYFDGNLVDILSPGTKALYWKEPTKVKIEKVDISTNIELTREQKTLLKTPRSLRSGNTVESFVQFCEVPSDQVALLYINGTQERVLNPGEYAYWKTNRTITSRVVDCRLQSMEVGGQEILTKDKVSLRINLSANFRVKDPEKAVRELSNYSDFLYKELQFGLREAVGTKLLDELLANKDQLRNEVDQYIQKVVADFGIEVRGVGVKDIILPGDMKLILNQVVEAEKSAEANIIRRREETAATRSLHNTAKMMENNPILLRLKELEVLERVTEKIDKITVFGGLESVLKDLVKLPGS